MLKKFWKESVAVIKEKDPAFKSAIEVLLYPSFWAVVKRVCWCLRALCHSCPVF